MRWDPAGRLAILLLPMIFLSFSMAGNSLAAHMQKANLIPVIGSGFTIQKTQTPADVLTGALSGAIGAAVPGYPYPAPAPVEPEYDYCFYDDGWHGPGYYGCGYAWRTGYGWGGDSEWGRAHGYDRHDGNGHQGRGHEGHGREAAGEAHGGHFGPHGGRGGPHEAQQHAAFHGAPPPWGRSPWRRRCSS